MRTTFIAPLLLAATLCLQPVTAATTAPPQPLRPLTAAEAFSGASFAAPRLSPDGRYLALLVKRRGRMGLSVFDLQAGKYESHIGFSDSDIDEPRWLGSSHLLYTLAQHGQSRETQAVQGGLFVTTRDGRAQRKLHNSLNAFMNRGLRRYTQMWPLQTVPGSDDEFIAACNDIDKDSVDLYRVNAATGKRQRLTTQRPARTQDWLLDRELQPRVVVGTVEKTPERVVHYREADGRWRELVALPPGARRRARARQRGGRRQAAGGDQRRPRHGGAARVRPRPRQLGRCGGGTPRLRRRGRRLRGGDRHPAARREQRRAGRRADGHDPARLRLDG